jgi:hypothetical protein
MGRRKVPRGTGRDLSGNIALFCYRYVSGIRPEFTHLNGKDHAECPN